MVQNQPEKNKPPKEQVQNVKVTTIVLKGDDGLAIVIETSNTV